MSSIILDLDYTLLDTARFKAALSRALEMPVAAYDQAYQGFVQDNGLFEPKAFLEGVTTAQQTAFYVVLKKMRSFLYPDTLPFLRQLQQQHWKVTIITYGNQAWQQSKLDGLTFSSDITTIATEQSKIKVWKKLTLDAITVAVDDKATEIDAIQKLYPAVQCYWIKRPNGRYHDRPTTPHHVIHQLTDITI